MDTQEIVKRALKKASNISEPFGIRVYKDGTMYTSQKNSHQICECSNVMCDKTVFVNSWSVEDFYNKETLESFKKNGLTTEEIIEEAIHDMKIDNPSYFQELVEEVEDLGEPCQ